MKNAIVIPVRLNSQRLPKKALIDIEGKTLIQRVVGQCLKTDLPVYLITDSQEIADSVCPRRTTVLFLREEACSGTERIANAIDMIPADGIINVQGDQPFVDPQEILVMNEHMIANNSTYPVITPSKIYERDHPYAKDPNKVKVVAAKCGRALYFSRHAIGDERVRIHMGVYGYRRSVLERYQYMKPTPLEQRERLEQLRFLENDIPIYTYETERDLFSVDTPQDLEHAREIAWEYD